MLNESIEVWTGKEKGWIPGTITHQEKVGFQVKHSGHVEETIPTSSIKRCVLGNGDTVEVWSDTDTWAKAVVQGISTDPVGYNIVLDGQNEVQTVGAFCVRRI